MVEPLAAARLKTEEAAATALMETISALRGYANEASAMSAQFFAMNAHSTSMEMSERRRQFNLAADYLCEGLRLLSSSPKGGS